jgi:hypothetical protein
VGEKSKELSRELIQGAYDLHTHSAPSHVARALDDFELLREADQVGLAGVLLKCHYGSTEGRAAIANLQAGTKAKAFGAVTLNWPVGGLNPYAVAASLKLGGKMVYMPTRDALNGLKNGPRPNDFFDRPGLTIYDENGGLKPEVYEIFEVVKQYDAYLSSGHLAPREAIDFCLAGLGQKVRVVLTHPDWSETLIPVEKQAELASQGVLIEKCWINTEDGSLSYEAFARTIKAVGAHGIYLTTDRGQAGKQKPAEAMLSCLEKLLDLGIDRNELRTMVHDIPKAIVL